jgi:hypothetical protein
MPKQFPSTKARLLQKMYSPAISNWRFTCTFACAACPLERPPDMPPKFLGFHGCRGWINPIAWRTGKPIGHLHCFMARQLSRSLPSSSLFAVATVAARQGIAQIRSGNNHPAEGPRAWTWRFCTCVWMQPPPPRPPARAGSCLGPQ